MSHYRTGFGRCKCCEAFRPLKDGYCDPCHDKAALEDRNAELELENRRLRETNDFLLMQMDFMLY